MLGLFKALQSGLSQKTTETLMPTNGSTTTVNPLLNRTQDSIELVARVGNALERGEREGWIEASKREKRGATGAVKQQKEKLSELNSLLRGNKIQIRLTSISNNYASFNVQGSNRGAIKSFSIGYYDGDRLSDMIGNSTIIVATNRGKLGKFEPEDVNYGLWSNAFNDIRNIEFNTPHKGEQFLDSVLPSLGRVLLGTNNPLITGTSTVGTTTLSTETVSHDDPNYIFNIAIESSTEPIENNTSTELFDFASSKAEERSTTEGIDHTMQGVHNYTSEHQIADGAFSIGNGTATWINRQTNRTGEVSVFNGTNAVEPTAVSVEEPTAGMSATEITGWATLGGLGLFLAGVGVKKLYDYCCKTSGYGIQDLDSNPGKEDEVRLKSRRRLPNTGTEVSPLLLEGQRQPLNPENTSELPNNGGATVITMEQEPKATEPLLREGDNSAEGTVVSSPRAERHNSSISGSLTSLHSNSTGVSVGSSVRL